MRYLLFLILNLASGILFSQTGYISFQQVAPSLPEFESLQKKYTDRSLQLTDTMNFLIKDYERIVVRSSTFTGDTTSNPKLNDSLMKFQEKLQRFQAYSSEVLKKEEKIYSEQLMKAMQKHLKLFCEKKKLTCMVEKDGVLYCPGCKDYTTDMISFLKQK